MLLVPINDDDFLEIPVKTGEVFEVVAIDVSGGVPVELVHDVLLLRIHAKDDRVEGHTVLYRPHYNLKVGVP